MRQADFLQRLRSLLAAPVEDLSESDKLAVAQQVLASRAEGAGPVPELTVVSFVAGRRATDEIDHPGLGSSDGAGLVVSQRDDNRIQILYRLGATSSEPLDLDLTLRLHDVHGRSTLVPGWKHRRIEPRVLGREGPEAPTGPDDPRARVVEISPDAVERAVGEGAELEASFRDTATEPGVVFSFGQQFHQRLEVELRAVREGVPVAADVATVELCDMRRLGSLYERLLERVLPADLADQSLRAGVAELDVAYHPWFPVLRIGTDKAALYNRALIGDLVDKSRHLTDPAWLLRVGLYLELLTCLGVFEAVRGDLGDLLSPAEREVFEESPGYAAIREHVDVAAWRDVWELRKLAFPRLGTPRLGPVSALNLLQKKRATLAFLHAHHEDLKQAIRLAGANRHNAQETWHRVFRDAERAVLRQSTEAFPELEHLAERARHVVLWHRRGHLDTTGTRQLPEGLTTLFGDQDGLYASACNQYRDSMNEVAEWARERRLMDWAGSSCVPERVSLLQAFMSGRMDQLARLQRRDGYAPTLEIEEAPPEESTVSADEITDLLEGGQLLSLLSHDERLDLASRVRTIRLGPVERILVQGEEGSSIFVVADGELEVLWRRDDGRDLPVATLTTGSVVGEQSFLTGAPRSATVRSIDGAVLYEIGRDLLRPYVETRPELLDAFAELIERRGLERHLAASADDEVTTITGRIRQLFLSEPPSADVAPS